MNIFLVIESKDKKSIIFFLKIFYSLLNKINIIRKKFNNNNKLNKFAILRSPHIFKIAQEHFEFKNYRKKILLILINSIDFFLFLKIFSNKLFYDINIKINYFISKNKNDIILKTIKLNILIIKNLYLLKYSNYYKKQFNFKLKIKKIFKFLTILKIIVKLK